MIPLLTSERLEFSVKKVSEIDETLRKEIIDMLVSCFPDNLDFPAMVYTSPDLELCVLGYLGDELVAHVGINKRKIIHQGKEYLVGGIGDVAVIEKYRSAGVGQKIMQLANRVLEENNFDVGLLFCHPKLDLFYTKCGWLKKEQGKIFATVDGRNEDQRRAFYLPLKLSESEIALWNSQDIRIGNGTW